MMQCVVYNRVSSMHQASGISLQAQEAMCRKYATNNNMNVSQVYQEVHSVFHKSPPTLSAIINSDKSNKTPILFVAVDRFSRSVAVGVNMAKIAISNNIALHFIREDFVCDSFRKLSQLVKYLKQAEGESRAISNRVKSAKNYLEQMGIFTGAQAPYGFVVRNRKLVPNQTEQLILEFIKLCKTSNIPSATLNTLMRRIVRSSSSQNKKYNPIDCYNKKNEIIPTLTEKLLNTEISALLNSYNITKRDKEWVGPTVSRALKSNKKYAHLNHILPNTDSLMIAPMDTSADSPQIRGQKRIRSQSLDSAGDQPPAKRRRSPRLTPHSGPTSSPTSLLDLMDVDQMNDSELFAQFRKFQEFIKTNSSKFN